MKTIAGWVIGGCLLVLAQYAGLAARTCPLDDAGSRGIGIQSAPLSLPKGSDVSPATSGYHLRKDFGVLLPAFVPPVLPGRIVGSGSFTLCEGDSIVLFTSPSFRRYRWTTGDTTSAIVAKNGGSYGVTVTDAGGIVYVLDPVTISVLVRPVVHVTPSGPLTFCDGDSVTLDAGPGFAGYQWSNGATTRMITVKKTGAYGVSVTGSNGCTGYSGTLNVITSSKPNPKVFSTKGFELCVGDTTMLYGYGGYAKYLWSTGDTTRTITIWGPGDWDDYRLTVTDSLGCSATSEIAPVKFHLKPSPRLTADGPKRFCEGDSVTLDAGQIFGTYLWSTGDQSRRIVIKESGKYWLAVTDGIGCPGFSDTVAIVVNKRPNATITGPGSVCAHSIGTYSVPSRPGLHYSWRVDGGGSALASGQGTSTVTVQWGFPGTSVIFVTVTVDSTGCSSTTQLEVDVDNILKPTVTASKNLVLCPDDSITLDAGDGFVSYDWSNGAKTRLITVHDPGSYSVTVVNAGGCSGTSDPITVSKGTPPSPKITTTRPTALCYGDSVKLDAGAGYESYDWSDGEHTQAIVVKSAGQFTVTVTDQNGCVGASAPVFVVMQAGPSPTIQGPRVVCRNSTITYVGPREAGSIYEWSVSGGTLLSAPNQPTAIVQWGASGTGTVDLRQVVIVTGCSGTAPTLDVTIGDSIEPSISAVGSSALCPGSTVILDAGAGLKSYLWSTGETTQTITVSTAGMYVVTATDSAGCSGTSQPFPVIVKDPPTPTIDPAAITICEGDSVRLDAPPGFKEYLWTTGAATPSIIVRTAGDYGVTVWDSTGCMGISPKSRVKVHPAPSPPTITFVGDSLVSTSAVGYAWTHNGSPVVGGTTRTIPFNGEGEYQVRITDEFGCTSISSPFSPVGLLATTVAAPVLEGTAGDRILFPLVLAAPEILSELGSNTFTATIRFDKTLLRPVGSTPMGVIDGPDRVITITGTRPESLTDGPLVQLEFVAMLGDTDETALTLDDFTWDEVNVHARTVNGTFRLTGLCLAGGTRLLRADGEMGLKPSRPNPATGITEIEYETVEHGWTRLSICDPTGRRVATLVDASLDPGRYLVTFDAGGLASGLYVYTLETPTQRLSRTMVVAR